MKARALKALKQSIAHWKEMRDDPACSKPITSNCALCKLFFLRENRCDGCPVAEKAEQPNCNGTPYLKAYQAWNQLGKTEASLAKWRAEATKEIEFLESLLPKANKRGA